MELLRFVRSPLLMTLIFLLAVPFLSAVAQPDPLDEGYPDSAFVVIPQPRLGLDTVITAELYFFNDQQVIVGASLGLGWDNDQLR